MIPHRPYHWVLVALVIVAALFTLREVHGQTSTGARSQFEGMPAMAGAQAGLGAQAGPPQGGLGVEGNDAAGLQLRRPRGIGPQEPKSVAQAQMREEGIHPLLASNDTAVTLPPSLPPPPRGRKIERDTGVAQDTGSTTKRAGRSVRHTAKRLRHPIASIDMHR